MVLKRAKRCHFFEYNGRPIGTGCSKGAANCTFVHPEDPEWDELPSPAYPRARRGTYDRARHGSPGRKSRSRETNSRYRSRSPAYQSPTVPRSRFAFRAEAEQNEGDKLPDKLRDSRPRAISIASSVASNTGNILTGPRGISRIPQPQAQVETSINHSTTSATLSSTTMQQSVPPLPQLPTPPVLLIVKQPPPRAELSAEEKRKAWAEHIQLLSDSFQQRTKLAKIDQDIGLIKRLTLFSPNKPLDSNHSAEVKLATLELQREEARKNYDSILSRITAIDSWPVPPPAENDDRVTLNKMVKYCEDLQHSAEEINRVLSRVTLALSPDDVPTGDPSRPLKRRRIEEDGEQGRQENDNTPGIHEELRDRALAIQSVISSIQNDQIVNRNDLVAECKEYIDTKFEESTAEATKTIRVVEDKVEVLENDINSAGDDIGELAGVIEEIILHNNEFRAGIAETNQKVKETQARVARLEERMREIARERSQFMKAVEALKAAHDTNAARPMSPPASPNLPPLEYIVQNLHDPLLEAARSAIKPMLTGMRDNIQGLLQERNTEMYQTLWKRLSLTLKLVDALSARLTPAQGDGVHSGGS